MKTASLETMLAALALALFANSVDAGLCGTQSYSCCPPACCAPAGDFCTAKSCCALTRPSA